jgi:hypothetical protein
MKFPSAELTSVVNGGFTCLSVLWLKFIVVLSTVLMIMLAKAITIVIITPIDITPPVNVLYYVSCS